MKAIRIERFGAPDVLVERDLPSPEPAAGEIKIKVMAAGVNFADILQRLHLYGNAPRLPYVPGFEVSGVVMETGEGVTQLEIGDRVVSLTRFGGYAEEVIVPAEQAKKISSALGFNEAAALPVNFLTAWMCLFDMGGLKPGEWVLIQTAAGGVGTAAVQLALNRGAHVIGTVGSREKARFVTDLGAQHVICYREEDFVQRVREIRNGHGVDVVLDAVGATTLRRSFDLLDPLGRCISYGLSAAAPRRRQAWIQSLKALLQTPRFSVLNLIQRNVGIFGFHLALLEERRIEVAAAFDEILSLVSEKRIEPKLAKTFPLSASGAAAAHEFIHQRRNLGKVVLARS